VTHTLYQERELEKVRREAAAIGPSDELHETRPSLAVPRSQPASLQPATPRTEGDPELARLRGEMAALQREFAAVRAEFESTTEELRRGLDELNRQLGN